ncbi:MAG: hypothetical protein EOO12_11040 [Chitinophagaceae bacterium]|nr:MAG: hypothetical protein EOO12_11040 [Chitinophagaceae bacterium]
MKKNIFLGTAAFAALCTLAISCVKDPVQAEAALPQGNVVWGLHESFDSVGKLTSKGWVIKNLSEPMGSSGWRQGRYESAQGMQYKFNGPVPYIGFPAFRANTAPTDFISVDVSAINGTGNLSAWLISPQIPMKNGDTLIFYTRTADDANYPDYTRDRLQVLANFTDGTANVGSSSTSTGSFTTVLADINQNYIENFNGGYPEVWARARIVINNIPNGVTSTGRFAFRYVGNDAGLQGPNFASIIGIDELTYKHKGE